MFQQRRLNIRYKRSIEVFASYINSLVGQLNTDLMKSLLIFVKNVNAGLFCFSYSRQRTCRYTYHLQQGHLYFIVSSLLFSFFLFMQNEFVQSVIGCNLHFPIT